MGQRQRAPLPRPGCCCCVGGQQAFLAEFRVFGTSSWRNYQAVTSGWRLTGSGLVQVPTEAEGVQDQERASGHSQRAGALGPRCLLSAATVTWPPSLQQSQTQLCGVLSSILLY